MSAVTVERNSIAQRAADLRIRLAKGTALNLAATVCNQGSTLAANVFVARLLGKALFGEYAIVQSTLLTVAGFAQLAVGYTASKYVAEFRVEQPERTGRILWLCSTIAIVTSILASGALLLTAPWLARTVMNSPNLSMPLMIGAVFLLFTVINGYQLGALAGLEDYKGLAIAGILSGTGAVAAIAAGAWLGCLLGAVQGLAVSSVMRMLFHNVVLRRELERNHLVPCSKGALDEREVLYSFALPAALAGFVLMPAPWLANVYLVDQKNGFAELALYTAASNVRMIVLFLPRIVDTVGRSVLNNVKGRGRAGEYLKVLYINIAVMFFVSVVGAACVAAIGQHVVGIFGKEFLAAYPVVLVLLAAACLEALYMGIYHAIQSHAKMWQSLFYVVLPWQAGFLLLVWLWVPGHPAMGMAYAYLGSCVIQVLCTVGVAIPIIAAQTRAAREAQSKPAADGPSFAASRPTELEASTSNMP